MAKKIGHPLVKQFPLEKADPGGDTYVTIRQAKQREQEEHDELYAETSRVWNDQQVGVMELKQRVSMGVVQRREVELTLVDSNILDADGKPLFTFKKNTHGVMSLDMTPTQFREAWGQLDPDDADEIHAKVREMNPQWGPLGKAS